MLYFENFLRIKQKGNSHKIFEGVFALVVLNISLVLNNIAP